MASPCTVLFLCTGNSARSIMAEALVNARGGDRFRAHSAGSQPKAAPNPLALEKARALGLDPTAFRSKSWDEFAAPGAPRLDVVITVCDSAAGESCPIYPGGPLKAHWSFPDPHSREDFDAVFDRIARCVERLVALPWETLDPAARRAALAAIGTDA
jgi:arsenate reductase